MEKEYAKYLLFKTKKNYNLIAKAFSKSRWNVWTEFGFIRDYIKNGDKILDIGCGNGRLLELLKDKRIDYIGIDNSEELIRIAKNRYPQNKFLMADALNLPFAENSFDKIFSVAVFHHIPSKELRSQFLKEARRVLKPEGFLILAVWNLWKGYNSLKLLVKYTILKFLDKSKLDFKDIFAPWQKSVNRYVHCFTKNELKKLVRKSDLKIKKIGILRRKQTKNYNIYLIAKK